MVPGARVERACPAFQTGALTATASLAKRIYGAGAENRTPLSGLAARYPTNGMLLSAFFWSYSLCASACCWLIDRHGVGRVYAAGFFIWTVSVALTSFASIIAVLIAMRMLLGLGQGVPFPASVYLVANWFEPGERGGVTGVTGGYLAGNRLGQAAIGALGPTASP
jgi:MFS family permease